MSSSLSTPLMRTFSGRSSRRVLVLGSDTRSFLTVVRSLGRAGLTIDCAWIAPDSPARKSKYISNCLDDLARYSASDSSWLDALLQRASQMQYDLVIPTSDPSILPLQKHRSVLDPHRFYLLENEAFEITNDKIKTHQLATSLGIPVPGQRLISTQEEAREAAYAFGYPLILKPSESFTLVGGDTKHFVRRAANAEELLRLLPQMLTGVISVQPFFRGRGVGVEILARDGTILAKFQHERVHEPLQGGGSSYRKSAPINPHLLEATARLIKALRYTGVAMVEFKINQESGRFVLIEINGRFWGSLPLAVASGANFPFWLYQMWVENRDDFSDKPRIGLYCRNLLADYDWFISNLRADHSDPTLATVPLNKVIGELWHLVTFRERFDTLVIDDPAPGLVELGQILKRIKTGLRKLYLRFGFKLALRRRVLRYRALQRLRKAKTLLFVCKGNICRSPFAAEYAKRFLPHKSILSAGYYPFPDRSSPSEAITAALALGIDLKHCRSSVLTEGELRNADAVIVFDEENYFTVRDSSACSTSKIVFLGVLNGENVFIEDPYGTPPEHFEAVFKRIAIALDTLRASNG